MGLGTRALKAAGLAAALPALTLVLALTGCGGSSGAGKPARSGAGEFPGYIAQAESTFHPSDFGLETWEEEAAAAAPAPEGAAPAPEEEAAPDTMPGFRVQVAITENIDDAAFLRDSLSAALPDEWVYVVHHPPYYKVRVGDFGSRHLAEGFLEALKRAAFPDAWIVPDRVLRFPPPKPLPDSTSVPDPASVPDSLR